MESWTWLVVVAAVAVYGLVQALIDAWQVHASDDGRSAREWIGSAEYWGSTWKHGATFLGLPLGFWVVNVLGVKGWIATLITLLAVMALWVALMAPLLALPRAKLVGPAVGYGVIAGVLLLPAVLLGGFVVYDAHQDYARDRARHVRMSAVAEQLPDYAGAVCHDGWVSPSTGSGTCSWHGGVRWWASTVWSVASSEPEPPETRYEDDLLTLVLLWLAAPLVMVRMVHS